MRRRAGALLVLLILLGPVQLVAGPALAQAGPALGLDGTPVTPGDNTLTAPALASGRYVATLKASTDDSYLQVPRTIAGSTIWVGATLDLGRGSDADGFEGELFVNGYADGASSHECWNDPIVSTPASASGGGGTPHFETWLRPSNRDDPACQTAEAITLELSPFRWTPPEGTRVQLVIWEQPPVGDVSGIQAPSDTVTWSDLPARTAGPLRPGTTWAEAPDISDASATFHVGRNGVAVFRMPLTWGQHAQALIGLDQKVKADDGLPAISAWWASPMGGAVREPRVQNAPGDVLLGSEFEATSYAATTPTVNYRNRELPLGDQPLAPSVAGDYFLVVYVGTDGIPAGGLDFTLRSGFYTDYAAVGPPYRSTPPALAQVADFTPASGTPSDDRSAAAEPTGDGRPWPLVVALAGGALLFGVLGAGGVLVARRRRRT